MAFQEMFRKKFRTCILHISAAHPAAAKLQADYRYRKGIDRDPLLETLRTYGIDPDKDPARTKLLLLDMLYSKLAFRIEYPEYFLFDFEGTDTAYRRSFIGDLERVEITESMWTPETPKLFQQKNLTYERLKEFYRRNVIFIESSSDTDRLTAYADSTDAFIVKPYMGSFGKGIFRVDGFSSLSAEDRRTVIEKIFAACPCVLEDLIVQCNELAAFHPQSLNTVRITTYYKNDRCTLLFGYLRTGVGDNVVDNAGMGGIYASLDLDTGVLKTDGFSEANRYYTVHPDSGLAFKGFSIPRWEELLDTVYALAAAVPEQPYVGWDMALTDDGWVCVEGNNRGQMVHQYVEKKGFRKALFDVIDL